MRTLGDLWRAGKDWVPACAGMSGGGIVQGLPKRLGE